MKNDSLASLEKLGAKIKRNAQGEVVHVALRDSKIKDSGLVDLTLGGTPISEPF